MRDEKGKKNGKANILLAVSFSPRVRVCVNVRLNRRWEAALAGRRRARLELAKMRADIVVVMARVRMRFVRGN